MSNPDEVARYREVARYAVELRWHAPRMWGERNLPRAGRFYAWALFVSPTRRFWTYAEATGIFGPGGVEATELAILTPDVDPNTPDLQSGESFELSRAGVEGLAVAANGRVLRKMSNQAET
jgi:hypothetical protein